MCVCVCVLGVGVGSRFKWITGGFLTLTISLFICIRLGLVSKTF